MTRSQRILVPIDFSEHSRKALRYALELTHPHNAEIVLLHVIAEPFYGVNFDPGAMTLPPIQEELQQAVRRELKGWQERELPPPLRSHVLWRSGSPFAEICRVARSIEANLIVMGTHGYSAVKHVLLGSTAERVVRSAPCPVLVVREGEREFVFP